MGITSTVTFRCCILLALLTTLFTDDCFSEETVSQWQGEWGKWQNSSGGEFSGGHFSIFDCQKGEKSCRGYYLTHGVGGGCNGRLQVSRIDERTASATALNFKGQPAQCLFSLTLTADGKSLRVTREGSECGSYCTKDYFPLEYPLIQRTSIIRNWDLSCYTDTRAAHRSWCESQHLQDVYTNLETTASHLQSFAEPPADQPSARDILNKAFAECETKELPACLNSSLERDTSQLSADLAERQKLYSQPGDVHESSLLIERFAGVYKHRFANSLIDGTGYDSEDILEIVRVSDDAIYFKTHLDFYNGHICSFHGIAQFRRVGAFVYVDTEHTKEEEKCRLTIAVNKGKVLLQDPGGICRETTCGARGGYTDVEFPIESRRPIRYMKRLLESSDYISTLEKYRQRSELTP